MPGTSFYRRVLAVQLPSILIDGNGRRIRGLPADPLRMTSCRAERPLELAQLIFIHAHQRSFAETPVQKCQSSQKRVGRRSRRSDRHLNVSAYRTPEVQGVGREAHIAGVKRRNFYRDDLFSVDRDPASTEVESLGFSVPGHMEPQASSQRGRHTPLKPLLYFRPLHRPLTGEWEMKWCLHHGTLASASCRKISCLNLISTNMCGRLAHVNKPQGQRGPECRPSPVQIEQPLHRG